MEHAGEAGGREHQRPGDRLAEQGGRGADARHVGQHVGDELAVREGAAVPRERHLIIGAAVYVVEDGTGQRAAGEAAEVRDVVGAMGAEGGAEGHQTKLVS